MAPDPTRLNMMPFARHLGFRFERIADGTSIVSLGIEAHHENMQGGTHGGIVPVVVDAAGTTALWSQARDKAVLTSDLRVNYLAPIPIGGRVRAVGTVTHLGPSIGYASVVVSDAAGQTVALGQITAVLKSPPRS